LSFLVCFFKVSPSTSQKGTTIRPRPKTKRKRSCENVSSDEVEEPEVGTGAILNKGFICDKDEFEVSTQFKEMFSLLFLFSSFIKRIKIFEVFLVHDRKQFFFKRKCQNK
jgi:hypothetical protein